MMLQLKQWAGCQGCWLCSQPILPVTPSTSHPSSVPGSPDQQRRGQRTSQAGWRVYSLLFINGSLGPWDERV